MKKIFSGFLALCLVFSIFSSNFITKAEDKTTKIIATINTSKFSEENVDLLLKKGEKLLFDSIISKGQAYMDTSTFSKYCKRKNK